MPEDRRLAAIMFTDIVGYTALMGKDEDKAFKILRKNRNIQKPLIKKYHGKWLKEMGDGILASFHSTSDAVRCAIEIQQMSKKEGVPLRIGIHEGEVVFEGGDVLGDGVNVASRLEELAQEGSINISGAVYKDIRNKAGIIAEFIEEKSLKNVEEPIKVYSIQCDESVTDKISDEEVPSKTRSKLIYYILSGFAIAIIAVVLIWKFIPAKKEVELDKSIAVLPLKSLSADPEKQYLADGVTDAITGHLSKIADLRVIPRTSVEQYRGTTKTAGEIGKELNVNYLIEGSFQMYDSKAKLIFQLINTKEESHEWFKEYEREWKDIFAVQSEVAQDVANEIKVVVTPEEKQEIETIPTSNLEAYDYYLLGVNYNSRSLEEQNFLYAIQMYEKAIEIDPNFTLAWVRLAASSRYLYFFYDRSEERLLKTKQYLNKALTLSPQSKEVLLEEGRYYYQCKLDYPKALQIFEKLKSNYPNDEQPIAWIGYVYRRMGEFRKSLEYSDHAISLSPSKWGFWSTTGQTYEVLREYNDAEKYFKKAIDLNPSNYLPYMELLNLYFLTGDVRKAKELLKNNQEFIDYPIIKMIRGYIEILDGNYQEAIQITESFTEDAINEQYFYYSKHLQLGMIYYIMSIENLADKHFEAEKIFLEEKIKESNNDSRLYRSLGIAYAGLGNKTKAIEAGRKAVEILGFKNDALGGFYAEMDMTKILLMVGEYYETLSRIENLLDQSGYISIELLQIDPFWNPVRDMGKFQEIISNPKYQDSLSEN
jgi:TolB-like protein/class 3 adenylate cyclase/Flp pilus assembly protein TadD